MSREEFRPVVGWPGYSVSRRGRVRSEKRIIQRRDGTTQRVRERMLRICHRKADDYRVVTLYRSGFRRVVYVHTLVSEAWPGHTNPAR
jgi:NUMOD4 motif